MEHFWLRDGKLEEEEERKKRGRCVNGRGNDHDYIEVWGGKRIK